MAFVTGVVQLMRDNTMPYYVYVTPDEMNAYRKSVTDISVQQPIILNFAPVNQSIDQPMLSDVINYQVPVNDNNVYIISGDSSKQFVATTPLLNVQEKIATKEVPCLNNTIPDLEQDIPTLLKCPGRPRKDGGPKNCKKTMSKCTDCDVVCRSGVMFQRHLQKCHPERQQRYICDKCPKVFKSGSQLIMHAVEHWEIGKQCPLAIQGEDTCCVSFTRRAALRTHLLRKHTTENADADENKHESCEKVFTIRNPNKSQSPLICTYCSKGFDKPSQLERHNRVHTGEKPFVCNECGSSFSQKNSLVLHMPTHSKIRPHKCIQCSAVFSQKGNLRMHVKRVHPTGSGTGGRLKCPFCPCYFKNARCLNFHHLKSHQVLTEDEKILETISSVMEGLASLSDGAQVNKSDILQTALSCSGVTTAQTVKKQSKPKLVCRAALGTGESATSSPNIYSVYKHTKDGISYYQCSNCQKDFLKVSDLLRHIPTHSSEKPYKCDNCDKSFLLSSRLTLHKQNSMKIRSEKSVNPCRPSAKKIADAHRSLPANEAIDDPLANILGDVSLTGFDTKNTMNSVLSTNTQCMPSLNIANTLNDENINEHIQIYCSERGSPTFHAAGNEISFISENNIIAGNGGIEENPCTNSISDQNGLNVNYSSQDANLPVIIDNSQDINNPEDISNLQNAIITIDSNNVNPCNGQYILESIPITLDSGQIAFINSHNNYITTTDNHYEIRGNMSGDSAILSFPLNGLPQTKGNVLINDINQIVNTTDGNIELLPSDMYSVANNVLLSSVINNDGNMDCSQNSEKNTINTVLTLENYKEALKVKRPTYKWPKLANCCQECPASFNKYSDLVRHTRIHTREKPYSCTQCNKSFSIKSTLKTHQAIHLSIAKRKKVQCKVCGKMLASSSSLIIHLRLHNDKCPYPCPICPATFRSTGLRNTHTSTHFKDKAPRKGKNISDIVTEATCITQA